MNDTQLSLFDTTTAEVGSRYKVGDYVKLRKKPAIAAHVKRGNIFRINAVHPSDGSMRFWNPHSSQWDFLYPDEVSLVPAPLEVDTESIPPVDSVSKAIVIPDDTESIPPVDSVSKAIVIPDDTESIPPVDSVSKAISTYRPCGTARSGEYFRFSYRDGSRMRHIHIRGGNTDSPISQAKVAEVRSLLAAGIPPVQIATMLQKSLKADRRI